MTYSRPLKPEEENAIEVFYWMVGVGVLPLGLVGAALWWAWYRFGRKKWAFDWAFFFTGTAAFLLFYAFITRLYLARYWVTRWGGG